MSPTVSTPRAWSLAAVFAPTPHTRSTGSGCRNVGLPSGGTTSRPSGLATALATLARNLVRATPTVIARPTSSRTSAAQRGGDVHRRAGDAPQPADVEEGLVDRDALDERGRVLEHGEHGLARLGVGLEAGRHDDRPGHRRCASPPPIAVRTPYALAS